MNMLTDEDYDRARKQLGEVLDRGLSLTPTALVNKVHEETGIPVAIIQTAFQVMVGRNEIAIDGRLLARMPGF